MGKLPTCLVQPNLDELVQTSYPKTVFSGGGETAFVGIV